MAGGVTVVASTAGGALAFAADSMNEAARGRPSGPRMYLVPDASLYVPSALFVSELKLGPVGRAADGRRDGMVAWTIPYAVPPMANPSTKAIASLMKKLPARFEQLLSL